VERLSDDRQLGVGANPKNMDDFDLPFAYEALATL
jgi:hypothetical protein